MNFLNKKIKALPRGVLFMSVITRMELLADPKHTQQSEQEARDFINSLTVVPINDEIEYRAILFRRKTRRKLPDSIIAATAMALGVPLVTQDRELLALDSAELPIMDINCIHE
jgi:predicted nucleic acid-binding protein